MNTFEMMEKYGYEELLQFHDDVTGLKGFICIHNSKLGPCLGGTRVWFYENEDEAKMDVMRLAKGMTYKSACAGVNLGGAKAVIWCDKDKYQAMREDGVLEEAFFRAFGRHVNSLNGRYITAEDVNTRLSDMDYINMETDYVTGLAGKSGNPSPVTALGVFYSVKAAMNQAFGTQDLKGKKFLIQGVGNVSTTLCKMIHEEGGELIVADLPEFAQARLDFVVKHYGAKVVSTDEIMGLEADCYCPCALGGTLNPETIANLKVKVVAGAANNVLEDIERDGQLLHDRGIVYAPDYVANAGGVINVYHELLGYKEENVKADVAKIYERITQIIKESKEKNIPTAKVADLMAERRIEMVSKVKLKHKA